MSAILKLLQYVILVASLGKVLASPKKLKLCIGQAHVPTAEEPGEGKEEILEDLGSHLVSLATKNKISATEASALVNKCRRGGINIKVPFKPAEGNPKKRAIWGFKEEPGKKEPGDGTAAKSLTRWLKRENKWAPLYWADIPLWNPAKKKVMSSHPFLLPHDWLEFYLCRKVPAKKDSLKKAAFMRRS